MSYPMTWPRALRRNDLDGDYSNTPDRLGLIRGDLRRVKEDQTDEYHLARYAEISGCAKYQVKAILEAFFAGEF